MSQNQVAHFHSSFKCVNRAPFKSTRMVQDGWTEDGRRKMVEIKDEMSKDCKFDLKHAVSDCAQCKWNNAHQASHVNNKDTVLEQVDTEDHQPPPIDTQAEDYREPFRTSTEDYRYSSPGYGQ